MSGVEEMGGKSVSKRLCLTRRDAWHKARERAMEKTKQKPTLTLFFVMGTLGNKNYTRYRAIA